MSGIRNCYLAAAWSFISLAGLFMFYLRFHAISARYLMDLAAGFAVACAGGLMLKWRPNVFSIVWRYVVLTLFAVWWCWDVSTAQVNIEDGGGAERSCVPVHAARFPELQPLPKRYIAGDDPERHDRHFPERLGLEQYQRAGLLRGLPVLRFAAKNFPGSLAELTPAGPTEKDYANIRAKVGLEFLKLESMKDTPRGKRLIFAGPKRESYRHGIQLVSLGFISPEEFNRGPSPFQLLEVSCEDNP